MVTFGFLQQNGRDGDGNYDNTSGARIENVTITGSNNKVNIGNDQDIGKKIFIFSQY